MSKQKISKHELQNELNSRLHKLIGDERISFGGIYQLAELDSEGSNWSESITMKGSLVEISQNSELISQVLLEVRQKFNIDE